MWKDLLGLLVVPQCLACRQALTRQERLVCLRCLSDIPQTDFHLHPQENELYRRLAGRVPLKGACCLFYFDKKGLLQRLLQELKYRQKPQVGFLLGELYGEILMGSSFLDGVEGVIPVPLHRSRQRKRGYNQVEKIVEGMARKTGLPVLKSSLKRIRHTTSQTRKRGGERWENVAEAFVCEGNLPNHVLIVDDVVTTGATLEACIRACLKASADPLTVSMLSIGMARDE